MDDGRKACWSEGPLAELWRRASAGDGIAACQLGDAFREGRFGLRESPTQTYYWYARSALAGDPNGRNNLGACFEHGLGCTASYVRAVKWYRLAAAQGLGTASMNLAYCHLRGKGLPADRVEAVRLFRQAVAQGESRAREMLEKLGVPVEQTAVRFVDETQPGRMLGLVGGVANRPPEEWVMRDPVIPESMERAVLKDDCFDLPEQGTPQRTALEREAERTMEFARRRGLAPDQTR